MGYYTSFYINAEGYPNELTEDEANKLCEDMKLRIPVESYGGDIGVGNYPCQWGVDAELEAKWYDFDRDMIALSLNYPEVLFTVEGRGEDQNDMWIHYYYDGKAQRDGIVITMNRFDIRKLQPADYYQGVPKLANN